MTLEMPFFSGAWSWPDLDHQLSAESACNHVIPLALRRVLCYRDQGQVLSV